MLETQSWVESGVAFFRRVQAASSAAVPETFDFGRSHTEIARLIAFDHDWRLLGDQIIDTNGIVVADTLEEAARKMLALGWFEPSGVSINWHHFGGTKATNADTLRGV